MDRSVVTSKAPFERQECHLLEDHETKVKKQKIKGQN